MSATAQEVDGGDGEPRAANAADLAIRTRKLRKVFDSKVAVRGLTLEVHRGEVFGFLGPNGAGKSTSVKMLLGLVKPTSGDASILGEPAGNRQARAKVGFLPEHFRFYDWLTSFELLRMHGELCGMDKHTLRNRIPLLLEQVGLTPHAGKQLRQYSKGMLQRTGMAQALINDPELIFLDEPTSGLDPVGRRLVRDLIARQRERGATVFLNSHLLSEVEITCDRVAFIRSGTVIEVRPVSDFADSPKRVTARVMQMPESALQGLATWATEIQMTGQHLRLRLREAELAPRVIQYLVDIGAELYEFTPQRDTLEDRFLEILGMDQGL